MKAYVIRVPTIPESVEAASKCIASGKRFGLRIQPFDGCTPEDEPESVIRGRGWDMDSFHINNKWSKWERMLAAFVSHSTLWIRVSSLDTPALILEHDAVVVRKIPGPVKAGKADIVNVAAPSYGRFSRMVGDGIRPIASKAHLPGAHGYVITPAGARDLIEKAKTVARPTDVFIHRKNFPELAEHYPWCVECHETFSTIQKESGCVNKHKRGVKLI